MRFFKKKQVPYNSMHSDIRLHKISLDAAERWLRGLENKWVYIKYVSNLFSGRDYSQSDISHP